MPFSNINEKYKIVFSFIHTQYTNKNGVHTRQNKNVWSGIKIKSNRITHLVIAESMYTNFSPSVPSSFEGTEARKLRRSLFFSNGSEMCKQRLTFCPSTRAGRRHNSRKIRMSIVLGDYNWTARIKRKLIWVILENITVFK